MNNKVWQNKRVLVTGHTGFKGSWLSLWLNQLGAKVYGVALNPPSEPNLFTIANVSSVFIADERIDIRDGAAINHLFQTIQPEIVFHLAAQPLVHYAYDSPHETYAVNVMGSVNVLEAIRQCPSVRAAVIVTTDKCYENNDKMNVYEESDKLGGRDPYSSSKACAELVTQAYRASYFSGLSDARIASARAGNVIGGGDWASDRLIPDCIRAYLKSEPISLRYPHATRPWQHVLDPIYGYLLLAEQLMSEEGAHFCEAWNFGPEREDMQSVLEVVKQMNLFLPITFEIPTLL